jgi:hypothetical protein
MLGIGLHSYGFMDAAFQWLRLFVGSQILIIGLGLLPLSYWKSFRLRGPLPPPAQGGSRGGKGSRAPQPATT